MRLELDLVPPTLPQMQPELDLAPAPPQIQLELDLVPPPPLPQMQPELDLVPPPPHIFPAPPPPPLENEAHLASVGSGHTTSTCGVSVGSGLKIGGAEVNLPMMAPLESFAQSVGSTTAITLEDDAESSLKGATWSGTPDCDSYTTPKKSSSLPFCGSTYEPDCDDSLQPRIGMVFDSWEDGEAFYTRYAHEAGFSVRRFTQHKGGDGVPVWKRFFCARQGWREDKDIPAGQVNKPRRKVKLSRCGCEAMIGLKRRNDNKYEVARFVHRHTHQFVSPNKKQFLRSNREVSSELRSTFFTCNKALLGPSATYRLIAVQKGSPGKVGCTLRDMQNYYRDFKEIIRDADAQTIIDAMESKQKINPTFFFRYELDDENKLTHIFWADGTSRKNYALFGNVLSFDSTYRTNRYDLVFAPFTGINHHKDCVTFGGSFLCHEKIGSYRWLFKAFLEAMRGVAPTLIITDEDKSMKAAIEEVLPNTVHRLCMWHILNKVPEKVGRELNKNEDFQREFSICVWASETPDEFEEKWSSVISDFGLQDNEWLAAKYEIRQSWIPAYFRGVFLSGLLRTTSRSESENAFFGHFIHRRLSLLEFWIRYETAIEEQRQKELEHDNASLHTLPVLVTTWSIENHAREVYTHTVFMLFQAQVVAAMEKCDVRKIEQVGEVQTTCISHGKGRIREVVFNSSKKDVQCSCKLFESVGIPCSHMIVVLKREQFSEIPSHYVLDRWKKTANQKVVLDANGNVLQGTSRTLPPVIDQMYSDTYSKFNMGMMAAKHCEEKMQYLHKGINDLIDHVLHMGPASERTKVQEFESFIGVKIPSEINIHPPAIAHTKGAMVKGLRRAQKKEQVGKKRGGLQAARRDKRTRLQGYQQEVCRCVWMWMTWKQDNQ